MTPRLWAEIRDLLGQALELPREEREAFVRGVCAGRPEAEAQELRRELESLIAASFDDEFLSKPALEQHERAPERIGPYQIDEELGRGGMGTVYLATRVDGAFLHSVAIKILNRGMDTDYFVSRFRYERQLLAYLNHPAIVRLLDGGSTDDGRPFLVTEYIEGESLIRYCERTRATLEEKLRLMIEVADAVHHAHQRLIIHCDIKPNNILVTREGKPKLLDFGVGRMFIPGMGEALMTAKSQRLITPGYASPEQFLGEPLTTATDVFSLGATLYELVVGKAPFGASITSPETRTAEPISKAVRPEAREFRSDLDTIIGKAMRNAIGERYESAEQFAADLRRYLQGEPITARPLTVRYQLSSFVRRNRALTASVGVAALALVVGTSVALWQRGQAVKERDTARALLENSRQLAHAFVFDMDDRLQKEGAIGARRLLVEKGRAALDQLAAQGLNDEELGRDVVAAYLKMGDVLGRIGGANLGRIAEAQKSYARALELSRELLGRYPKNDLVRDQNVGVSLRLSGISKAQGDPQTALRIGLDAVKVLEGGGAQSLERMRLLADAYHDLGGTYSQLGDWAKVIRVRERAMAVNAKILSDPKSTLDDRLRELFARTRLASVLSRERRFAESDPEFEAVLAEARRLARENPGSTGAADILSNALMFAGISAHVQTKFEKAVPLFEEAYALRTKRLSGDPNDWRMRSLAATSLLRLGLAEIGAGRTAPGTQKLREALRERSDLAALDPDNVGAMAEKGEVYAEMAIALPPGAERETARRKAQEILGPLRQAGKLNQILLEVFARAESGG